MSFTESQVELMQSKIRVAEANALEALGYERSSSLFDSILSDIDGEFLVESLEERIERAEEKAKRCRDALNALHATYREIAREVHEVAKRRTKSEPYVYLTTEQTEALKSIFDEAEKE